MTLATAANPGLTLLPELGFGLTLLLVLGVVVASLAFLPRARRVVGPTTLRLLGLAALGVLLLNPSRFIPAPDASSRPGLVMLVDRSLSMSLADETHSGESCSRFEAVRRGWLGSNQLTRFEERANLRLLTFAERLESTSIERLATLRPEGEATRLVAALDALIGVASTQPEGRTISDLLVLSDGIDTDDGRLADLGARAAAAGLRIHAVAAGSDLQPADLIVTASPDSPFVYDGQDTTLRVRLRQTGLSHQPVRLTIRQDGPDGPVLHQDVVLLDPERSVTERSYPLSPHVDDSEGAVSVVSYHVAATPLEGEADLSNNERWVFLQVASDRIRIALFEAEPYWDTRFFVRAMRDDPQVELTTIMGLGRERVGRQLRARMQVTRYVPDATAAREETDLDAPLDEEDLYEFDVIVLGRGIDTFFPGEEADRLVRFVTERGGSLLFLRGPAIDPENKDPGAADAARRLETISPVTWGQRTLRGSKLYRTDAGQREPALNFDRVGSSDTVLSELPDMLAATEVEKEKALSVVWLRQAEGRAEGTAAMSHMSVGRGRTLALLSDGMWRWAFLPPSQSEYSSIYAMFWSRAMRWLALGGDFLPGQSVSLGVDRVTVSPGDNVNVSVRTRFIDRDDFNPRLELVAPDGTRQDIDLAPTSPGGAQFAAACRPDAEGVYDVILHTPGITPEQLSTRFAVYDTRVELLDTASRPNELRRLAEATGGKLLPVDGADELVDVLQAEVDARRTRGHLEPAWDRLWIFTLIAGLLAADWMWRRRIGLA
ncbi:MAG: VWA domain-containing protein [Phycisphaerales bacterium]|nr:VWA domain-containing protein [Phycisphaerales bacterium]